MKKELEEDIKRALITKHRGTCMLSVETLENILNHIENSIPKKVIEENKEIEKIEFKEKIYTGDKINTITNKLNELVRVVNKINKEREGK